jgi:CDP-diacylglycerol--glycerol-3-phosphate 3-phosphatidyltransferase
MVASAALYLLYVRHFQQAGFMSSFALFVIYVVIALTDLVDGIIARKFNMVTELGKELDPMADKVLVFLMLFAFWRIRLFPMWSIWIIVPIFARDLFVNYLRKQSKILKISFKTSNIAKAKTAIQMTYIGFVLAIPVLMDMKIPRGLYNLLANIVSGNTLLIIMILVMAFTVYTGVDYYVKFRNELKKLI